MRLKQKLPSSLGFVPKKEKNDCLALNVPKTFHQSDQTPHNSFSSLVKAVSCLCKRHQELCTEEIPVETVIDAIYRAMRLDDVAGTEDQILCRSVIPRQ